VLGDNMTNNHLFSYDCRSIRGGILLLSYIEDCENVFTFD
jgi:hypothetical protein